MSSRAPSRDPSPIRRPLPRGKGRRKEPQSPQEKIDEFWSKFQTKAPGKATCIVPQNEYAERAARRAAAKSKAPATTTEQSYEAAAEQCRRKVAQIVVECRRVNQRYRDPHFDLDIDHNTKCRDCLDSLNNEVGFASRFGRSRRRRDLVKKDREDEGEAGGASNVLGLLSKVENNERAAAGIGPYGDSDLWADPKAVKRVVDIFDEPQFFVDGPTADDVRQGRDGDCWLMAALCTLSNKPGLIERCCVAHDQDVGVYGFVFHRDGEWFSEIIDDKLYLTKPDFDVRINYERALWEDGRERVNSEEAYRRAYQSNSGALYFAHCVNPNETWLPLLEKAYAKAHGDYSAIDGGFGGEGIEDLTGGVTSEIHACDILDKEHFWNEELMKVNQDFLFSCSTGIWGHGRSKRTTGIVERHAYSVLKAREIDGVRLVLLKNPWGKHEWKGSWSDGSKEWTAEWLQKLDHKFGDDGAFWISYPDLLRTYQAFDRTRLFSPEWKVASIWTTLDIGWTLDYHDTKFAFTLSHSGPVVLVFSQLDERYFKGLEGQYTFELSFRVHAASDGNNGNGGRSNESYIVRSQSYRYGMSRSVNVELDLDAGEYIVVVKVDAHRNEWLMPVEEVVRAHAKDRREKLLRIGQAYDVAHAKGKIVETAAEKEARQAFEKRRRERERKRAAKYLKSEGKWRKKEASRGEKLRRKANAQRKARAKAKADRKAAKRAARAQAEDRREPEGGENADQKEGTAEGAPDRTDDENKKAESSGEKQAQGPQPDGVDAKEEDAYVTAAEDNDKEATPKGKNVKIQAPLSVNTDPQAEGSVTSTEPGEGQHTPTSSTLSTKTPVNGEVEDLDEDEAYTTAAEDDIERQHEPVSGGPSTPKPVTKPATYSLPLRAHFADASVQTDTGHPDSLHRQGPPPSWRERHYSCPPPPPPGHRYDHGHPSPASPQPDRSPPLGYETEEEQQQYISDVSSDSEIYDEEDDADNVSEISERNIDLFLESVRRSDEKEENLRKAARARRGSSSSVDDDSVDEFERDPWNAVGVFGLRVYYKMPSAVDREQQQQEAGVSLRVERPNPDLWDDSSDDDEDGDDDEQADGGKEQGRKEESHVLDVDDSAKDAVGETPPTPGVELLKQLKEGSRAGESKDVKE